ncbi:hypothetical protein LCGC14_1796160 [marine sediment metagenome]|uniref:Uncharacterized protein n=1 Tax=marine sediment metagenome TaxID=412755 RepID=A0A0F9GR34_9ZZZZ|nr:hypothetical protein [Candidatus Aminicenantes bacterium]
MYKEALKAIGSINQEIYDFFEEKYSETFPILELQTDGFYIIINFMGNYRLWFSEEDEREFDEDKNDYEPFEPYLRRETQKIIDQIGSIKIKED